MPGKCSGDLRPSPVLHEQRTANPNLSTCLSPPDSVLSLPSKRLLVVSVVLFVVVDTKHGATGESQGRVCHDIVMRYASTNLEEKLCRQIGERCELACSSLRRRDGWGHDEKVWKGERKEVIRRYI